MVPEHATRVRVWNRPIRLLHWGLAFSAGGAWLTTVAAVGWHQPVGYAALLLTVLRVAAGLGGCWALRVGRYARFTQFVRSPGATARYVRLLLQRREPRYIGHNPLGGWMTLALLACVAGLGLTGWLYTTDRFWGDETVERIHQALAWALAMLAALHVGGVLFTSWRHRENLVRAMVDGRKRAPAGDDIG